MSDVEYPEPKIDVPQETLERFHRGFSTEEQLVNFVREYLLTENQRLDLFQYDLTVEDILNGRYDERAENLILYRLFKDWNEKLNIVGHKNRFGF